ncbi:MAG TPA: hypothetical protein VK533_13085 [Sphingomonas sp.]|uniref:hypothetical protein n=1 Tax=Sphingomonas sp. TaxID=28214 RepID=UPI002BB6384D|nr:hypothetical protein [Sphingomonas sp.]HMI20469.1 hypothetical protein [Sphingomonas sp.]
MAKKDKTPKLPKKVGGVKLPKQLRKSAGVVADIAQNPIAREVVSAALVAGAAALAKRKITDKNAAAEARKPNSELSALIAQGQEIGNMISQGINAFVSALLKPAEKKPAAEAKPAAAKPAARKPAPAKAAAAKPAAKRTTAKRVTAKPATAKPAAAKRKPAAKPRSKPAPKPTTDTKH